ncbi:MULTISPECIES: solanesyl diphosphate synthase [Synechococcus]|uniref:solanesyl diphosphate synthase n=1 Tax=Synechococcus TaxID=1129 RepID=UPI000E93317E|nr:solanesyl diphosphate synthase [Synechococcus lacustris]MCP9793875.1 solanesyl diphosphate synthase [Synechococcus lacustris L1F-Slac]HBU27405.1 solanesyl diphosphate synthase [Synechococcales bacterium UBA8138]
MTTVAELLQPVESDLEDLLSDLRELIGAGHPILQAAAEHLFSAGGKRLRPGIVLLLARAIDGGLGPKQRRLAEITEMIHTASLVHDDVVDEADTRRGVATVHSRFSHRVAVLAGDFLFAQSSWHLANLENLEVVKLLSRVIMDLAEGEIRQGLYRYDTGQSLETYLEKSYRKTASLMANSAKAAGVLSNLSDDKLALLYEFGRLLGLAFQVVDDILDFTSDDVQLGKPSASDLASGTLTAPVIYAMEEFPALAGFIEREFNQPDDLKQALALVDQSQGIARSRLLAERFAREAASCLDFLAPSQSKAALLALPDFVLSRLY